MKWKSLENKSRISNDFQADNFQAGKTLKRSNAGILISAEAEVKANEANQCWFWKHGFRK